jgi:hypothetical protein
MKREIGNIFTVGLIFAASVAMAVDVPFIINPALAGSTIGTNTISDPSVTIITNASGNDLVYSFTYENVDLDGGGTTNDTISWDMRWEFFEASSLGAGQITPGTYTNGAVDAVAGWADRAHLWNRDTLKFTIENVSVTADAGYAASFNGFNRIWLTAGTYYIGEGAGTIQHITGANGNLSFDPEDVLLITAWGNERNRSLVGSFTVEYSEPVVLIGEDDFSVATNFLSRTVSNSVNSAAQTWNIVNRAQVRSAYMIDTSVVSNNFVAVETNDTDGFLQSDKTDHFFGIYRGGLSAGELIYTFDISGYDNLNLAMDWAASGDIPNPGIVMTYSIDGAAPTTNFLVGTSNTDWIETMEIGTVVTNNRSAAVTVNGALDTSLSDTFQTYNPAITGSGSVLTVKLTMASGVTGPAYGMDNLKLYGTALPVPESGYDAWAESYDLTGTNALESADIEPDGLDNLMEYALGGNPTNSDASAVLPVFQTLGNYFYHIHNERTDDIDLTYTVELTTDLVSDGWSTNDLEFVGEAAFSNVWKMVTNRTDLIENAEFIQLKVEK